MKPGEVPTDEEQNRGCHHTIMDMLHWTNLSVTEARALVEEGRYKLEIERRGEPYYVLMLDGVEIERMTCRQALLPFKRD